MNLSSEFRRFVFVCAVIAHAAVIAHGASPTGLKPQGYVNDFAGVIDAQSAQELTRLAGLVEQKTKAVMILVAVKTTDGEPVEDFAAKLFHDWGVGHKDNRGVMLLLDVGSRKSRLEVGYGLEPVITDGVSGEILRAMRPALGKKQYGDAALLTFRSLAERIAKESGVALDAPTPPAKAPPAAPAPKPWWNSLLVGFFAIVMIMMFAMPFVAIGGLIYALVSRKGRFIGGTGASSDSSSSSFSSDSSGSSDSSSSGSDSFSGGDSGGGGASSDW